MFDKQENNTNIKISQLQWPLNSKAILNYQGIKQIHKSENLVERKMIRWITVLKPFNGTLTQD